MKSPRTGIPNIMPCDYVVEYERDGKKEITVHKIIGTTIIILYRAIVIDEENELAECIK